MTPPSAPPRTAEGAGMWLTRVVGFFVVLCLVAIGTSGVVAGFFTQRETLVSEPVETVSSVVVDTSSGDVTLVPAASGRLRVERTLRWSFDRPAANVAVRDGVATVSGRCSGGFTFGECTVEVVVEVPSGVPVRVTTTAGDVTVRDVDARLDLQTTSGNVQASGLRSKDVRLQSTVGDLAVAFATAPDAVTLQATTGDVSLRLPVAGAGYRIDAKTSLGDEDLTIASDASSSRTVVVQTSLGDITVAPA